MTWSHSIINKEWVALFCILVYEINNFRINNLFHRSWIVTLKWFKIRYLPVFSDWTISHFQWWTAKKKWFGKKRTNDSGKMKIKWERRFFQIKSKNTVRWNSRFWVEWWHFWLSSAIWWWVMAIWNFEIFEPLTVYANFFFRDFFISIDRVVCRLVYIDVSSWCPILVFFGFFSTFL